MSQSNQDILFDLNNLENEMNKNNAKERVYAKNQQQVIVEKNSYDVTSRLGVKNINNVNVKVKCI